MKAALGAVAAASVLSACGGQVEMGAAATFSSDRITTASLQQTVVDWNRDMRSHPDVQQAQKSLKQRARDAVDQGLLSWEQARLDLPFDPDSSSRSALNMLVEFRVWDEVAKELHITVTPGRVAAAIAASGGRQVFDSHTLLVGLPVSYTPNLVRFILIRNEALNPLGLTLDQQGQLDPDSRGRLGHVLDHAANAIKLKVNPRYGSFDPMQQDLALPAFSLSKNDPALNGA